MLVCQGHEALAPFIVPGSQHWMIYRVLDQS